MNSVNILKIYPAHTFISVHPETTFMGVILRSKATKNLIVTGSVEILRGVYPELAEGLRMTGRSFRMDTN